MNKIASYAIDMLTRGGESVAEDDLNEDGEIDDRDHPAACDLSIKMAHAIRDNSDSFLAWYRTIHPVATDD
jgi:hypothetical protein